MFREVTDAAGKQIRGALNALPGKLYLAREDTENGPEWAVCYGDRKHFGRVMPFFCFGPERPPTDAAILVVRRTMRSILAGQAASEEAAAEKHSIEQDRAKVRSHLDATREDRERALYPMAKSSPEILEAALAPATDGTGPNHGSKYYGGAFDRNGA